MRVFHIFNQLFNRNLSVFHPCCAQLRLSTTGQKSSTPFSAKPAAPKPAPQAARRRFPQFPRPLLLLLSKYIVYGRKGRKRGERKGEANWELGIKKWGKRQTGPLVKGGWLRRKPQTGGLCRKKQPFLEVAFQDRRTPPPHRFFQTAVGRKAIPPSRPAAVPPPFDKGG